MKKRTSTILRIATGAVLSVAGVMLLVNLGGLNLPDITRPLPEATINITGSATRSIVCPGPVTVFGVDTTRPSEAVAIGSTRVIESPKDAERVTLATDVVGADQPFMLRVKGDQYIAGASNQRLQGGEFSGQTALSCAEPLSDQWIVAASTMVGVATSISLANPGQVAATVKVSVFDETGEFDENQTSGVLVPPQSVKNVALNGFGGGKEATVIRVQSSGSPVVATASIVQMYDLEAMGAEQVNSQAKPEKTLIFAGVKNYIDHDHATDAIAGEHEDDIPAVLRLFSLEEGGSARVLGVSASGDRIDLATADFAAGVVTDTVISKLPDDVHAIIVESTTPVVGSVMTSTHKAQDHDLTWMVPSSVFDAGDHADIIVFPEAKVTFVNLENRPAEVTIADRPPIVVSAGSALEIDVTATARVSSSGSFAVGVTLFDERSIATYPALKPIDSEAVLKVYPR